MTDVKRVPVYEHMHSYMVFSEHGEGCVRQGTFRSLNEARNAAMNGVQKGEYAVVFELVPLCRIDPNLPTITKL